MRPVPFQQRQHPLGAALRERRDRRGVQAPPVLPLPAADPFGQGAFGVVQYRVGMAAGEPRPAVDGVCEPGQLPGDEPGGTDGQQAGRLCVSPLRSQPPHELLGERGAAAGGERGGQPLAQRGRRVVVRRLQRLVRYGQDAGRAQGVPGDDRVGVGQPRGEEPAVPSGERGQCREPALVRPARVEVGQECGEPTVVREPAAGPRGEREAGRERQWFECAEQLFRGRRHPRIVAGRDTPTRTNIRAAADWNRYAGGRCAPRRGPDRRPGRPAMWTGPAAGALLVTPAACRATGWPPPA